MKTAVAVGGNSITRYLGAEVEIEASGTWVKYQHQDIKRRVNGPSAAPFF